MDQLDKAFRVRRQAATLEKVIDFRQACGLPSGDIVGVWARLLTLAEAIEQSQAAGGTVNTTTRRNAS